MKISGTVTFGGSGLNRAAELRGQPEEIARLLVDSDARALVIWNGKPLSDGESLVWLPTGHKIVASDPLFLGLDEQGPRFAYNVTNWEPEEIPDAVGTLADRSIQHHPDLPEEFGFAELRGLMTRLTPRDAELAATARSVWAWHTNHKFCSQCGASSVVAMAGWQRDCPSCGAHHFPRTDPVVIMVVTRGDSCLIGRSPHWPPGMYSCLAGYIEPGETIEAAVRREVFEEAGVRVGPVKFVASQPWPFSTSLMIGCVGEALSDEITIDENEIEEARWITRDELRDALAGRNETISPARPGAIAHFLLSNWATNGAPA